MMTHPLPTIVAALAGLVVLPILARAQEPSTISARTCSDGSRATGALGYGMISCNCTYYEDDEDPTKSWWEFRSEPLVRRVLPGGPAAGKLETGDVIVAIEDLLITTRAGGRRFALIEPGERVQLTIRRNGKERSVEITAGTYCPGEAAVPAPPSDLLPPGRVPEAVPASRARPADATARVVSPPPAPLPIAAGLPRGWFGFSLECSDCGIEFGKGDATPIWTFASPPVIEHVERDGPADQAGLQEGDVITHVDDELLTSAQGGIAFGAVESGQLVTLRYERAGTVRTARLRAGRRATALAPARSTGVPTRGVPDAAIQSDALRFAGRVGDALIRVTGGPVTVSETEYEVVIRSRDITVRVSKRGAQDSVDVER